MINSITDFLNNQWIAGIGSGLIGALILFLVNLIVRKLGRKADYEKANDKCVELLFKYIDKNGIPSETVILSVFNVVAGQFNLDPQKLDQKKVLDKLLIQLIDQNKYSQGKTKVLLNDLENTMVNLSINRIDLAEALSHDENLSSIIGDVLILERESSKSTYDKIIHIINIPIYLLIGYARLFSRPCKWE